MIRLQADVAEIQGLAQAEAMRQRPSAGIAAQWSAAHSGNQSDASHAFQ